MFPELFFHDYPSPGLVHWLHIASHVSITSRSVGWNGAVLTNVLAHAAPPTLPVLRHSILQTVTRSDAVDFLPAREDHFT